MTDFDFKKITELAAAGTTEETLAAVAAQLETAEQAHQLFDIRLMQCRDRLGLPLVADDALDTVPEPARTQLEEGYVAACEEVGKLLLAEGKLREAWMYLRAADRADLVKARLAEIVPKEENIEDLVGVALHEGIDARRGFEMVLGYYGTCNAITTFEQTFSVNTNLRREDQQACAGLLLRQVHADLLANLRSDLEQQDGPPPEGETLAELVAGRDGFFSEFTYHIDVSHLSSVVRFARLIEDAETLRVALDLTAYGRCLHEQFQLQEDVPFANGYADYGRFFAAQLDEQVDEAVDHFREQAEAVDQYTQGTGAVEVYLALLVRLGKDAEAIAEYVRLLSEGSTVGPLVPSLYELSARAGEFSQMTKMAQQRGDVVSFTTGLIAGRP